MKIKKRLLNSPQVVEQMKKFYTKKVLASVEGVPQIPQSFKALLQKNGINTDVLVTYFTDSPRELFDFMDSVKKIIEITNNDTLFSFTINKDEWIGGELTSRKDAEREAAFVAVELLEKELNPEKEE